MSRYVRIENGKVVESFETDGDITTMFPPELVWVDVTDRPDVTDGWDAVLSSDGWNITAPKAEEIPKPSVISQILDLEASVTPRRIREAILTGDHSFIQLVDTAISKLRAKL